MDQPKRKFVHLSRAWYYKTTQISESIEDEITIGLYYDDGGCDGEFSIRWIGLGLILTPCIVAFSDSWSTLFKFDGLLKEMKNINDLNLSPLEFCKMLESIGFEDATPTKNPYGDSTPDPLYTKPKARMK